MEQVHFDRALDALTRARRLIEEGAEGHLTHEKQGRLRDSLDRLYDELVALEEERRHGEHLQAVTELVDAVAEGPKPEDEESPSSSDADAKPPPARGGVAAAIAHWEATHPRLAAGIEEVAAALHQIGI